jgi:hypothetical protein
MAERMIEMLYRPEMLPGMSVKEAAKLLHRLKYLKDTPAQDIKTVLNKRKTFLLEQKNQLLMRSKTIYDQRLALYLKLDRLELKELDLLAELKEILSVAKIKSPIIPLLKNAKTLLAKLNILRRELSVINGKKIQLTANIEEQKGRERRLSRRQIGYYNEQVAVLKDLIMVHETAGELDRELANRQKHQNRKTLEFNLRRIVRQLRSIDTELKR